MNAHDAAAKNAKLALVKANKAYLRTFEVSTFKSSPIANLPPAPVRKHLEPQRRHTKQVMRCNRWDQSVKLVGSSPRKASPRAANVPSMFGKPLAKCEG